MAIERILIVDDEQDIRSTLSDYLESKGYMAICAGDINEAVVKMKESKPDVILLDIQLPGMTGIEILRRLQDVKMNVPIIMMSGYATEEMARETLTIGAYDFLSKPFELGQLDKILASLEIWKF